MSIPIFAAHDDLVHSGDHIDLNYSFLDQLCESHLNLVRHKMCRTPPVSCVKWLKIAIELVNYFVLYSSCFTPY